MWHNDYPSTPPMMPQCSRYDPTHRLHAFMSVWLSTWVRTIRNPHQITLLGYWWTLDRYILTCNFTYCTCIMFVFIQVWKSKMSETGNIEENYGNCWNCGTNCFGSLSCCKLPCFGHSWYQALPRTRPWRPNNLIMTATTLSSSFFYQVFIKQVYMCDITFRGFIIQFADIAYHLIKSNSSLLEESYEARWLIDWIKVWSIQVIFQ